MSEPSERPETLPVHQSPTTLTKWMLISLRFLHGHPKISLF
jgi:hypothetical protein